MKAMDLAPLAVLAMLPALGLAPAAAHAAEPLREIDWRELEPGHPALVAGTVVETDRGWSALRIVHRGDGPTLVPLARIESPGVIASSYAVSGSVRYEDVASGSYLEMWNILPKGGRFFSRTLGTFGPMQSLGGSSEWREFILPAFLQDHPDRPLALEINLALTGPGIVEIGPLRLTEPVDGAGAAFPDGGESAWWSPRVAGLVGAVGGAGLGVLGAVLGMLVGLGRARSAVTFLAVTLLAGGLGVLALGILAVVGRQPWAVYYPLLLVGGMAAVFMTAILVAAPQRYRLLELRRMRAIDAS